jgi:hypothetical protein
MGRATLETSCSGWMRISVDFYLLSKQQYNVQALQLIDIPP